MSNTVLSDASPSNRGMIIGCVVATLIFTCSRIASADDVDAPMVHALIVADTNDARIGQHVESDRRIVVGAIEEAFPSHRRTLRVLEGDDATPENVLQYYSALKNGTNDTLLFYYAGHGAVDDKPGHVLTMQTANLSRRTLVNTIMDKHARLNIILTDCCSVFSDIKEFYAGAGYDHVTVRYLFFRHRGTVDLTAADIGKPAYGSRTGGIFTNALFGLLTKSPEKLDTDGDGIPSWEDLWMQLRIDARNRSAPLLAARDKKLTALVGESPQPQTPHAFAELAAPLGAAIPLPKSRFGVRVVTAFEGGARVTEIMEHSPAEWVGVQVGDIITNIKGEAVRNANDLTTLVANMPEGWPFPVTCELTQANDRTKTILTFRLAY